MYRYISKINKNILFKPSIFLVFDTKVFIIESFQDDHQELIGLVYTSEWNKIYKKAVFLLKNVTIFFIEEMAYQKKTNRIQNGSFLLVTNRSIKNLMQVVLQSDPWIQKIELEVCVE